MAFMGYVDHPAWDDAFVQSYEWQLDACFAWSLECGSRVFSYLVAHVAGRLVSGVDTCGVFVVSKSVRYGEHQDACTIELLSFTGLDTGAKR